MEEIASTDGYFDYQIGPTKISYRKEGNCIGITLLMTDAEFMGQGFAREAMMKFLADCDNKALDVFLTPVATERHVSKSRLRAFYASLGFRRNQQRERLFWVSATVAGHYAMCRNGGLHLMPKARKSINKPQGASRSPGM